MHNHPGVFPGKQLAKQQRRIAEFLCADYLDSPGADPGEFLRKLRARPAALRKVAVRIHAQSGVQHAILPQRHIRLARRGGDIRRNPLRLRSVGNIPGVRQRDRGHSGVPEALQALRRSGKGGCIDTAVRRKAAVQRLYQFQRRAAGGVFIVHQHDLRRPAKNILIAHAEIVLLRMAVAFLECYRSCPVR